MFYDGLIADRLQNILRLAIVSAARRTAQRDGNSFPYEPSIQATTSTETLVGFIKFMRSNPIYNRVLTDLLRDSSVALALALSRFRTWRGCCPRGNGSSMNA
jgi:hypothetical protein